jgi:glutathione S-transferase
MWRRRQLRASVFMLTRKKGYHMTSLILHHYPQSPVAHKIRLALGIAGASWQSVDIPRLPPKPLLTPLTAGYRRTPVLQIGADIYCDSQTIARAIHEALPDSRLFPSGHVGGAMMLSGWAEKTLFDLAVRVVLTHALDSAPPEFIKDRGSLYFEPNWSADSLRAALPFVTRELHAALSHVESCVAASSGVFVDGNAPSYADAAFGYIAWFLRGRWAEGPAFLAAFPKLCAMEDALADIGDGMASELSGEAALEIARKATPQSPIGIIGAIANDLQIGQQVTIRQAGETADPDVVGRLRYLDSTRVTIDHDSAETGAIAVHFPIIGYKIMANQDTA